VLARGRVKYQLLVCLLVVAFSCGGAALVQALPGFGLFRQPTRMFVLAAFPIAYLAGETTRALFADPAPSPAVLRRCRGLLLGLLLFSLVLASLLLLTALKPGFAPRGVAYWLAQPALVAALLGLLYRPWRAAWFGVLLAELWLRAWPLVAVRSESEIYAPSGCVRYVVEHNRDHGRVLDRDAPPARDGLTPLGTGAPLAMVERIEALRGYNPLDVLRYKEYLQFIADRDEPLQPFASPLTFPVIGDFPIRNRPLLDLLGVRYLLQPAKGPPEGPRWQAADTDPAPTAYSFVARGVRALPPFTVYENPDAYPRAFVVPHAAPLPERSQVLAALRETDFKRTVLLEGWQSDGEATQGEFRPATIRDYRPNRVEVEVSGDTPGYLVLADVWFPGWRCTVDGEPAPLYRANYLFRATPVGAGTHTVVFAFEPESYRRGRMVSLAALALVVGTSCMWGAGGAGGCGLTRRLFGPEGQGTITDSDRSSATGHS
jgi:hypothetical protein